MLYTCTSGATSTWVAETSALATYHVAGEEPAGFDLSQLLIPGERTSASTAVRSTLSTPDSTSSALETAEEADAMRMLALFSSLGGQCVRPDLKTVDWIPLVFTVQDLPALRAFLDRHPAIRPLLSEFYGVAHRLAPACELTLTVLDDTLFALIMTALPYEEGHQVLDRIDREWYLRLDAALMLHFEIDIRFV